MTYDEAVLRIGAPVRWMSKNRSRPHASRATLKEASPNGKAVILPWGGHSQLEEVPLDELRIWKSRDPILNPNGNGKVIEEREDLVAESLQQAEKAVETIARAYVVGRDTCRETPAMYDKNDVLGSPPASAIKQAANREEEPRVYVIDPEMRLIADADGRLQPEWDKRYPFRKGTALRQFGQMLVRMVGNEEEALGLMTAPPPPPPEPEPPPALPPQPEKVNGNGHPADFGSPQARAMGGKAAAAALSPEQRRARGRKAAAARWGKEAKAPEDDGSVTYLINALKAKDEAIKDAYAAVARLEEERKGLADRLRKAREEIDRILGV